MSPPSLPHELLEVIVGEVQGKDSLRACSLASKSLLVCSQRHLFRALCFCQDLRQIPSNPTQIPRLSFKRARELLTMSPHLAGYVCDLTLCLQPGQDHNLVENLLRSVSERLTRLAIFAFPRTLIWEEMPSGVTCLLRDIYVQPQFRSLSLAHIRGVPLSLILYATSSFEVISINTISFREDITSDPPKFMSGPRDASANTNLKEIVVGAFVGFQDDGRYKSILDVDLHRRLKGLRKLHLQLSTAESGPWLAFLLESDIQPTLEHLEIYADRVPPVLQLESFPVLRVLKLQFILPFNQFDSILSTLLTCTPMLESLSVSLNTGIIVDVTWPQHHPTHPIFDWPLKQIPHPLFQSATKLRSSLPLLTKVHCSQTDSRGQHFATDSFTEYIKHKFYAAEEAEILSFSELRSLREA
ncbi:hypothetical protein FB451DRAFT_1570698 [Mycena latifolia]|nr:hypothetical protein FB451DRAFT_1570698 [Mycena latifolia]